MPLDLSLRPGIRIEHYELIRELGRGGMGQVFLARDVRLGRLVAIKFLARQSQQSADMFLTEARTTARCKHENIVIIHDGGTFDEQPYMVLEYVPGLTLRERLAERDHEPISVALAIEWMIPVVRALAHAHELGIVHRDLKPANIMLTASGTIKVLDFGIAKLGAHPDQEESVLRISGALDQTIPGTILGTLPYMSPEQLVGEGVDQRSDIWAVGVMLYDMVTGGHPLAPFSRNSVFEVSDLDTPMPGVEERVAGLGPIAGIIDRCLLKRAADRTPSATTLLAELEALIPGRRGSSSPADGQPYTGLSAFQESDADRFFGRARDVLVTIERLRNRPLVALLGPSGIGKSSLVRAGIIPTLKRSGEGWDAFIVRPGRQPIGALVDMVEQAESDAEESPVRPSPETAVKRERLGKLVRSTPGYLGARLRTRANRKRRRFLLFIDQFEELYTLGASASDRDTFIASLEAIADDPSSPLRVILCMRSDFLDRVAESHEFMARLTRGLTMVGAIDRDGLREALLRPVEATGYRFESPALVERMLDGLAATRGALPLLQFTAAALWDARDREHRLLTEASYEAIGGLAGALASHADRVVSGLSSHKRALARRVFLHLVTPEKTRAVVTMEELSELAPDDDDRDEVRLLIRELVDMRLLVHERGGDDGATTVELVHESLIHSWPTLTRWLERNHEIEAQLAQLRRASREWHTSGRKEGLVWRGEPARDILLWRDDLVGKLTPRERDYLDAVSHLASRTTRRKQLLVIGTMAVLLGLLIVALFLAFEFRAAEREQRRQAAELRENERARAQAERRARQQTLKVKTAQRNEADALESARQAQTKAEASAAMHKRAAEEAIKAKEELQGALDNERDMRRRAEESGRAARAAEEEARAAEVKAKAAEVKAREVADRAKRLLQENHKLKEERIDDDATRPEDL